MIANPSNQELAQQIEQLVREHITISRALAKAAVERAFAAAIEAEAEPAPPPPRARTKTRPGRRRSPAELAALGERFYAAVCKQPGETMTVLAGQVRATAGELHVPVAQLKRAGRVRSAGQRSQTRYFPLISKAKAAKGMKA